ncbi:hypothetical protein GQ53DRAFT_861863 [Thozetella sp. PMI_491]|nr:hypothetical protein GQ53DRAFT_861863 [Thozetella sp. PMI_491]
MARHVWRRFLGYTPLASAEPGGCEDGLHKEEPLVTQRQNQPANVAIWLTTANVAVLLATLSALFWIRSEPRQLRTVLNTELRATSSYSPIFDLIDLEPQIKTFNGTLYASDQPSIARDFPNQDADDIWDEDIELNHPFPITREQVIKLGKNPDTCAKFEDSVWGLGDDAYVATLDLFHQLHCLNALRKMAYAGHYKQRVDNNNHEIHINHCADILFQALACSNNVNLVTMHWTEKERYPMPDFSINKYCINFEKFNAWHKANSVDIEYYVKAMEKPDGVQQEPHEVWHAKDWSAKPSYFRANAGAKGLLDLGKEPSPSPRH